MGSRAGSAPAAHRALSQEEPIQRDTLFGRERDQEIGVGGRPALIAIDILLEYPELARELTLRTIASNLGESLRKLSLEPRHR